MHETNTGIEAEWIFTATGHGKSASDGLGGAFKRMARSESLRRTQDPITNAAELFAYAKTASKTIAFDYVSKEDQEQEEKSEKYTNLKTINGTRSYHNFKPICKNEDFILRCKRFSSSEHFDEKSIKYVKKRNKLRQP